MSRRSNWRTCLSKYISSRRRTPHEWGTFDCWLFVTEAARAMGAEDHFTRYFGKYKTAQGALRVMLRKKVNNMADFAALHYPEKPPLEAQIGDIMAIPTDDEFGYALGILNGERVLVLSATGIDSRDRSEATRAFEV